jgi:exonuclease III
LNPTFNINNINKRLDNLLGWSAKAKPDVVSLQEMKAEQENSAARSSTTKSRVRMIDVNSLRRCR